MTRGDFITITNEQIYKEIQELKSLGEATLTQAKYTNGRVTKLEAKSLWLWISNHPFRFALLALTTISLLQLDIPTVLANFL